MKVKTYFKEKPERNEKYKSWIRSKPCLKCGIHPYESITTGLPLGIDAHHENKKGYGTTGGKCSDKRAVPLCSNSCHTFYPDSRHETSKEEFWGKIDIEAKIKEFNAEWESIK
jgi:hypothetical protein